MHEEAEDLTGSDSDLDAGLAAAFGDRHEPGSSILKRIERLTGVKSQLLLQDAQGDESPILSVHSAHSIHPDADAAEDDSRYQLAGEIARGGVGVIYKGRDRDLGRDVALKVLRRMHAGNPEIFRRFVEESQIGGQLQHPGIVPVYSLGLQHWQEDLDLAGIRDEAELEKLPAGEREACQVLWEDVAALLE